MSLQVCILTPDRIFWNEPADELILPTSTGQMGVLTGHAPLLTALDIGAMMVRKANSWSAVALMGGFALVQGNQVTILVNEAVAASSVQAQEAEETLQAATNRLNQATGEKEKVEATFAFKRARARYQLVAQRSFSFLRFSFRGISGKPFAFPGSADPPKRQSNFLVRFFFFFLKRSYFFDYGKISRSSSTNCSPIGRTCRIDAKNHYP